MAFSQLEIKRYEKILDQFIQKRRPPPSMRDQLDLAFRIEGQNVEIIEIRPRWREPERKIEHPVAKATYVKTQKIWKIYWQRADLKWHCYEPSPEVKTLDLFIVVVEKDEYGCFFG